MIRTSLRGAALLLALALCGTPALTQAATAAGSSQPVHADYSTTISPLVGFGYPWTGTLQLTLNPDNIITGYYRPYGDSSFIPVNGGRNGENVWLDIGEMGRIQVNGTLKNAKITGTAFDNRSHDQYKFAASLTK